MPLFPVFRDDMIINIGTEHITEYRTAKEVRRVYQNITDSREDIIIRYGISR